MPATLDTQFPQCMYRPPNAGRIRESKIRSFTSQQIDNGGTFSWTSSESSSHHSSNSSVNSTIHSFAMARIIGYFLFDDKGVFVKF